MLYSEQIYNKVLILERNLNFMFIDIAKYLIKFGFSSKLTILLKIFHKMHQIKLKKFTAHLIIIQFAKFFFVFLLKLFAI